MRWIGLGLAVALFSFPGASAGMAQGTAQATAPAPGAKGVHAKWDRLLKTYVKPGAGGLNRVDYAAFKQKGHKDLKAYLGGLKKVDPTTLGSKDAYAYYVNLYNAKTIDVVLDHYPVKSIKDISLGGGLLASVTGGPWKAKVVEVNGKELSLDDIEHGILRKKYRDPRVHYAVNCASIGCPNLSRHAYTGAKLNAQLDEAARAYVNSPRGLRFDGNRLTASSIYDWFQADFGGTEQGVIAHAKEYAEPALSKKLSAAKSIDGYAYDWTLNDTP